MKYVFAVVRNPQHQPRASSADTRVKLGNVVTVDNDINGTLPTSVISTHWSGTVTTTDTESHVTDEGISALKADSEISPTVSAHSDTSHKFEQSLVPDHVVTVSVVLAPNGTSGVPSATNDGLAGIYNRSVESVGASVVVTVGSVSALSTRPSRAASLVADTATRTSQSASWSTRVQAASLGSSPVVSSMAPLLAQPLEYNALSAGTHAASSQTHIPAQWSGATLLPNVVGQRSATVPSTNVRKPPHGTSAAGALVEGLHIDSIAPVASSASYLASVARAVPANHTIATMTSVVVPTISMIGSDIVHRGKSTVRRGPIPATAQYMKSLQAANDSKSVVAPVFGVILYYRSYY